MLKNISVVSIAQFNDSPIFALFIVSSVSHSYDSHYLFHSSGFTEGKLR